MNKEEKAMELYPIEDFPFREDAESQYKLREAFLKGVEFAQTNQPVKDEVREAAELLEWIERSRLVVDPTLQLIKDGWKQELEKALNQKK